MKWVVGVDEVGRGPIAGPVTVCALAMPESAFKKLRGQFDSKSLTHKKRVELAKLLREEMRLLKQKRVVIALGKIAFDHYLKTCRAGGRSIPSPVPRFGHGVAYRLPWGVLLLGSYHPSQQNTFTGKLTRPMFHSVFAQARSALDRPHSTV